MTTSPLQITYRDMQASARLDELIRRRADGLAHHRAGITACRVVVEAPSQRHRHGQHHRVRVELSVPGADLIASRDPANGGVHSAVREAFDAVERELRKHVDRRRERNRCVSPRAQLLQGFRMRGQTPA